MKSICAPLLAVLLTGCFPARFTDSPGVTGTIIDAHTRRPIAGARVFVSSANYRPPGPLWLTNAAGEFVLLRYSAEQFVAPALSEAKAHARMPMLLTREDGQFSVPADMHWGIYITPMTLPWLRSTLVVESEGYKPLTKMILEHQKLCWPVMTNFAELALERQPALFQRGIISRPPITSRPR